MNRGLLILLIVIVVAAGLFLVCGGCCVCTSVMPTPEGYEGTATMQAAARATEDARPTNTPGPSPTPRPTETPAPTAVPTATTPPTAAPTSTPPPGVGDDVFVGDMHWKVLEAKNMGSVLRGSQSRYPTIQADKTTAGKFIWVRVQAINEGKSAKSLTYFTMKDRDDREYRESTDVYPWIPREEEIGGGVTFNPGVPKIFTTIYEVGPNATGFYLMVNDLGFASSVPISLGELESPQIKPTAKPGPSPTPFAKNLDMQTEHKAGIWGMRLYAVKRAKTVYWYGEGTTASGTYVVPLVEFRNLGNATTHPSDKLSFYLQDARGRTFTYQPSLGAVLGAAHQFQAGHVYDDINPGLVLGIAIPVDVPPDVGDLWLRVKQHPGVVIYIGDVSQMEELK